MCDHGHHGHSHGHAHSSTPKEGEVEFSLYKCINFESVHCFNARAEQDAKCVFKPYDRRLDQSTYLESNEDDEQLILYIPFTGVVTLKSFIIIGGEDGSAPSRVKAWINRDDIDFSIVEDLKPVQEWELAEDFRGEIKVPTKVHKFQNVSSLTFFFEENYGASSTKIFYIGLNGEYMALQRKPVKTVYELRPVPDQTKLESEAKAFSFGF